MGKAGAQIEITASSSRLAAGLAQAYSKFQAFGGAVARGIGTAFKKINAKLEPGATMKNAVGHLGGDLMGRGMDAVVDAAQGVRDFERGLTRLGIATGQTPAQLAVMRTAMRAVSVETGVSSAEILAATMNYVDLTGDVGGAQTAMRTFARVAQASGASMSDVSGAAAALGDALKISPAEMEATFSGLINQGKAGAVTLKDFAGELAGLAPKVARFKGMMGKEGALQLGAAFQVARKGFGSASEAATGLEAMMGALALNAKKFEAAGVRVFDVHKDGTKTFRNLHSIVTDIGKSKLAKDPTLLNKAFGSKEGEAAFNQLYRLPDLYNQIANAGKDAGVVQRDLGTFLESDAGKMDVTFNRLKETIAAAFTPERINGFVNAVEALAGKLGPLMEKVGWIGDKLGSLYGAGQSVRGFISGTNENSNPYKDEAMRAQIARGSGLEEANAWGLSPAEAAARKRQNDNAISNAAAYDRAVGQITNGGRDDKSTPEGIRRAYVATTQRREGNLGEVRAGERYLEAAKVTRGEAGELYSKEMLAELKQQTAAFQVLATNLALRQTVVKIAENPVAAAVAKAPNARTRP